jgi:drug/metabolite transporter (DMT)-like permease
MYLVALLYAMFASVFIVCKIALDYTEPLFLVGSRMLVAGILIVSYQYFFHRNTESVQKINKKIVGKLICLGFFNIYLTNACEVWGLQYLTSAKTCFIYSLSPFASALFSFFLFSEKMSSRKWIGLTLGFIGFLPVMLNKTTSEEMTGSFWIFSWAELAVFIAAISSVYGWIILKQLVKEEGISFMQANGLSMLIGGSMALAHSSLTENWDPIPVNQYIPFIECSLFLIIISNFICYNLYGYLLKSFTATFMSFAGFITPLFTALFGWIIFGDTLTWPFLLSMGIVFLSLLSFYQEELKIGGVYELETSKNA